MPPSNALALSIQLTSDYASAMEQVRAALKAEGFGVLTEINMQATMKEKLGKDIPAYTILGACNPNLAYQAISQAPEVGLLLPCNVTLRQVGEVVQVDIIDPNIMMGVLPGAGLEGIAHEAKTRLERVLVSLGAS